MDFPPVEEWPDHDAVGWSAQFHFPGALAGFARGLFAMPDDEGGWLWFSPVRRGVLPLDGLKVSKSLRRSQANFTVTVDTAFADVVAGCANPDRHGAWISDEVRDVMLDLHEQGWAHSVEVWREDHLVGGLYGVAIGGLFSGESMFHLERDASKVALVALVDLLSDEYAGDRLLDVQWATRHLASLGVVELTRAEYLDRLDVALDLPLPPRWRA